MNTIHLKHYRKFDTDIHVMEFNPADFIFDVVAPQKNTKLSQIFSTWWKNLGYKLVGGINGTFFRTLADGSSSPVGLVWLYEGILLSDTTMGDQFMELIFDGKKLYIEDIVASNIMDLLFTPKFVISIGNLLVKDSKKNLLKAERFDHTKYPNPRTMIGQRGDTIVLAVANGRIDNQKGLTADQQADFMIEIGCELAGNTDGGGSSTMTLNGKVINTPSDGSERKIANGMLIYSKGEYQVIEEDYRPKSNNYYMVDANGNAETNYLWKEIACSCGDPYIPNCIGQRKRMQRLRDFYGNKYGLCYIVVDVWYRCKKCNDRLIALFKAKLYPNEPSPTTRHLWADACDIHVFVRANTSEAWRELSSQEVVEDAKKLGFNNLGKYKTFSHVGHSPNGYSDWDRR